MVMEACLVGIALAGDLRSQIHLLWGLVFPAFACYALACWRAVRTRENGAAQIFAFAILFRVTLLCANPNLSDDIYRYVWDGRVQLAGVNPYQHPPESPALTALRDEVYYPAINHKQIRTIYPPVAQLFFAAVCLIDTSPVVMRIFLVLCEIAMLLVLLKMLRLRGLSGERLLLYAWNPLAVLEISGSGHIDALAIALLMLAIYLLLLGRKQTAVVALGAAVLSKLVPLLAVPAFWRHMASGTGNWRSTWLVPSGRVAMLWLPVILIGGYAIYAGAGAAHILDGLKVYLMKWRFNDGIYTIVYELLRQPELAWDDVALERARVVCSVAWVTVAVITLIRVRDPLRIVFLLMAAHLLLSPTVHPWYLLWVLPFLPFFASAGWIYLSCASLLAYNVLDGFHTTGVWREDAWVKWAEYLPFVALAAVSWLRKRTRQAIQLLF
jgi:hypothetical protein